MALRIWKALPDELEDDDEEEEEEDELEDDEDEDEEEEPDEEGTWYVGAPGRANRLTFRG